MPILHYRTAKSKMFVLPLTVMSTALNRVNGNFKDYFSVNQPNYMLAIHLPFSGGEQCASANWQL